MPQYLLLLYNDPTWYQKLSPEEMQKATEKYMAWMSKPFVKGGTRLAGDPGRVVRAQNGKPRATDGPYSETKEILGGSYTIEAPDYDQAVQRSLDHPHLDYGGTIEVKTNLRNVNGFSRGGEETGLMLEHLFRHQSSRILAHLTRLLGPAHLELAEEAVQESMLRALQVWPHQGMPENAVAWLFRVAHNAAIDAVRRDRIGGQKSAAVVAALNQSADTVPDDPDFEAQLRDDELRLVFMCCHPRIPHDARAVLSLKIAGGFNVREIARAFLADDAAIAQRLVRARKQIRDQHLTLDMPRGAELKQRLDSVIEVIYLMFNEGYTAHEGEDLIRTDLCFEALRLGQLIASSSIAAPRVDALMALMALQAARLPARTDEAGDLILLEDQDRARWDQKLIAVGFRHFDRAISGDEVSEYHVQAAIAATHARGPRIGKRSIGRQSCCFTTSCSR